MLRFMKDEDGPRVWFLFSRASGGQSPPRGCGQAVRGLFSALPRHPLTYTCRQFATTYSLAPGHTRGLSMDQRELDVAPRGSSALVLGFRSGHVSGQRPVRGGITGSLLLPRAPGAVSGSREAGV